ncbi:hypothetical protein F0A17_01745 [Billgrantia pellis]|uniref:Uncharacterized protein n=1 Tax=Billgrantia pellis TaxID=2606936 RepID=A0A7V7G306_9GAMM|nr:hypothetical protein [Halomonas pellis]KAA0014397.1 hypothetical protein F0A17_01745 [Halomonas pellis]
MARTKNVRIVKDPHRGDEVPLAVLADRYDLRSNTVTCRYRAGKRGLDLIKPVDERRQPEHLREGRSAPTYSRSDIIAEALGRPGMRHLTAARLADLGKVGMEAAA